MGFFVRSKKVRKSPAPETKDRPRANPQYQQPPPPPPPSSQFSQGWHPGGPYHHQQHQQLPFRPAGLLPAPAGWEGPVQAPAPYQQHGPYPPIIVNQHHYYLGPPPPPRPHTPARPQTTTNTSLSKLNLGSAVDLAKDVYHGTSLPHVLNEVLPSWHNCGSQLVKQGNCLVDELSSRFDNVLTAIDQGGYNGKEHDIFAWQPAQAPPPAPMSEAPISQAPVTEKGLPRAGKEGRRKETPKGQTNTAAGAVSGSFFAKVDYYANSRLPMNLPPLRLYIPTYPLLCLAAQYSERVYEPPTGRNERDAHVGADWFTGRKAMVIKSVPMDYMNVIVFAIRGTATFMDWAVNLDMKPTSPAGFLDDPNNLCHAGFLSVARKMVSPVARRLRQLLEEDPNRASYSLLITGHSAGGAVASLLYSHMLATSKEAESELSVVSSFFKRIHCVTFGTPPVSLFPLTKPDDYVRRPQLRKSVFLSFVNEGDPVTRADKSYVKSLLELFAAPTPRVEAPNVKPEPPVTGSNKKPRRSDKYSGASKTSTKLSLQATTTATPEKQKPPRPVWKVPPSTLSCAGRIVVLRSGDPKARARTKKKTTVEERLQEGVVAQIVTDEQLREVIWGDPVAHMMRLYAGRIEVLGVGAVTGRGY